MATPDWLEGPGQITQFIGEGHPTLANTKDRCGQTIDSMIQVEHTQDGVHDARTTGLSGEIGTFAGNGAARTISLSNSGLTPKKVFQWENVDSSNLCLNPGFDAATTNWTPTDCTLASVAGGQAGNCLEVTRTGGALQIAQSDAIAVIPGKTYAFSAYVKSGTSGNEAYFLEVEDPSGPTTLVGLSGTSAAGWVQDSGTWYNASGVTSVVIKLHKNTATAGTMLFDTVSFAESTGVDITRIDEMGSEKAQKHRYQSYAWETDLLDNFQAGSFDVGNDPCNTSGRTNYYLVLGVDTDTVPVGDVGAGSDPDWITSSVLNKVIADDSATVSDDNIANNVESQIWTAFIHEHTVAGAHSITLQHARIETISWAGNDADDRIISCDIDDLDIQDIEVYKDGAILRSKSSDMSGDNTKNENGAVFVANFIQDITTNGEIEIGTGLNGSGSTYVAFLVGV